MYVLKELKEILQEIMKNLSERITVDPRICNGKPVIKGKRITVQTVLEFLKAGDSPDEIIRYYPGLTREDISACYDFAILMSSKSSDLTLLDEAHEVSN